MFDTNTQYALNKRNPKAIIYIDAFGEQTEISPEALGEEVFAQWKTLIDTDLHEEEKADHIYHDQCHYKCQNKIEYSTCCNYRNTCPHRFIIKIAW